MTVKWTISWEVPLEMRHLQGDGGNQSSTDKETGGNQTVIILTAIHDTTS
jgi:hypothetical protein